MGDIFMLLCWSLVPSNNDSTSIRMGLGIQVHHGMSGMQWITLLTSCHCGNTQQYSWKLLKSENICANFGLSVSPRIFGGVISIVHVRRGIPRKCFFSKISVLLIRKYLYPQKSFPLYGIICTYDTTAAAWWCADADCPYHLSLKTSKSKERLSATLLVKVWLTSSRKSLFGRPWWYLARNHGLPPAQGHRLGPLTRSTSYCIAENFRKSGGYWDFAEKTLWIPIKRCV